MGSLDTESFEHFLDYLKSLGIVMSNEAELRERLAGARHWRQAFATLAANGRSLGIRFEDASGGGNEAQIRAAFALFRFPARAESAFASSLDRRGRDR